MRNALLRYCWCLVLFITACGVSHPDGDNTSQPRDNNDKIQVVTLPDFTHLMGKAGPSVVSVDAYYVVKSKKNNKDESHYSDKLHDRGATNSNGDEEVLTGGSAIILDKEGYIITNSHVIENINVIKVTLMDRRVFMAKVIGVDSVSDLALLKIEADNLTPITVGDVSKVKVGEWVAALGAPFGFQYSLTAGIISAKKRTILDDPSYIPFLQVDAAINQGNSGGPLLNLNGEAIGINTQIYSQSGGFVGIAFAIPIDIVINVAEQLKTTGKVARGQLEVKLDAMSYELATAFGLANAEGALVLDVFDGNSAADYKLQVGDIILQVNGEKINSPDDLSAMISLIKPGEIIKLNIWRDAQEMEIVVTLNPKLELSKIRKDVIKLNENNKKHQSGAVFVIEGLDVSLRNPAGNILKFYNLDSGLEIVSIGSKAEALGFALGDIIVRVGKIKITSAEQLQQALKLRKNVPVFVLRNYQPLFIPLLNSNQESRDDAN